MYLEIYFIGSIKAIIRLTPIFTSTIYKNWFPPLLEMLKSTKLVNTISKYVRKSFVERLNKSL